MRDDHYEWDDRKAASNLRKHRVDFEHARTAFDDPDMIDVPDADQDEARFRMIGLAGGQLLVIIYTFRGDRIRIISARKANRHEQDAYFRGT